MQCKLLTKSLLTFSLCAAITQAQEASPPAAATPAADEVALNAATRPAGEGHVKLTMLAEMEVVVVNEKGEKEVKRVPAETVVPGDHIIYTVKLNNISTEKADNLVVNNAIPEDMVFLVGTLGGAEADVYFSVDKGKIYDKPENLKVPDDTEPGKMRPAIAKDYTNVQWRLKNSVNPGEEGEVYYRAELK